VPVTARLSRGFYERFGDDLTNELVEWFNAVDATYRADLMRVNELNFARFDAKVEQRFEAFRVALEGRMAALEGRAGRFEGRFGALEGRFERLEARMDAIETRMDRLEARVGALEARMDALEARMGALEARMGAFEARMDLFETTLERIEERMITMQSTTLRWMVGLWLASTLTTIGFMAAMMPPR
jgi:chromosome segregation ATPase